MRRRGRRFLSAARLPWASQRLSPPGTNSDIALSAEVLPAAFGLAMARNSPCRSDSEKSETTATSCFLSCLQAGLTRKVDRQSLSEDGDGVHEAARRAYDAEREQCEEELPALSFLARLG
jgi:hypothetical protein